MDVACCGLFALLSFIALIYYGVKVIISTNKIKKIEGSETTPISELIEKKHVLGQRPQVLEIKGVTSCEEPLRTPFSRIEAVCYAFKVTQYWTTPGREDDVDHTKIVHNVQRSCKFRLTDGTNNITVQLDPRLGMDIDEEEEREFKSQQVLAEEIVNYHIIPSNAYCISYEYTENYIPPETEIYFMGKVSYRNGIFHLEPGGMNSIISDKKEARIIKQELYERAVNIRWVLLAGFIFIMGFVGFTGKPEGLADVLRAIMEFTLEAM